MEQMVQIRCKNNKKILNVSIGSTLSDIFSFSGLTMEYGPISARVNNKIEGMHYRVYNCKDVEFLSLRHPSALRAYTRSLFFVLCKAVHDLYGTGHVVINVPVSNGYHCDLHIGHQVTDADVAAIRKRMQEIVAAAIPIHRHQATTEDAIRMFREMGTVSKVKLLEGLGSLYTTYYEIDGYADYYYGSMLTNTGQLTLFGVEPYFGGILLRVPSPQDPSRLGELVRQDKMFDIFMEHHHWQDILGISTIGDLNKAVEEGKSNGLIQLSEALQEKKIAQIADEIAKRKNVKMVLIAGPSSSGKTTTCKRLSVQLAVNGIHPIGISLDDYFVNREQTPRDETGDYDYEHLHALNIPLLNEQMNALFRGEEVELPRYNFQMGRSEKSGRRLRLQGNEVLVLEGIHALNPELTASIPNDQIFRVYASALTTILLDTHNYIPTTDNRLLRRIVRDYKYRGVSACDTIRRWPSVRRGENRWIFPYQENADAMFNSAMLFELAVLKNQALPLLEQVPENCEEYAEAYRLMKFLRYIHTIKEDQIPPTSLLREFLGGSSFEY
ncbi:AAA family ATPase [Prevotella sp. P3-120]|uniref:nucleoside kinase n=1 Tax=unclassified Prevotella TaxID=2638335 RepID=UPI000B9601B5|nr:MULTISPECIES: nucleoside kinase [unclassified Prevotella]MBS7318638.1 nucleoside kinase [Prevotella sp.]MCF2558375.1 nucleoside kinase [Xylanibacter brevis]OYP41823.1 AAA family ATPase [Prevotella sp. P5-50]OYP49024.1 AAA family ATPase [Prevotella sp. P3-92]OYP49777.1 AAA family ATPase [Prevotella sp. P3-120]